MDLVLQNLRVACRALRRQRAFTAAAVLTLGLGIGATTAIFSVVYGILLRPLPFPEAERLLAIGQTLRSSPRPPVSGSTSHVNFLDWQRESRTIGPMALFSARSLVTNLGEADVVTGAIVTPEFFDVFQSRPVVGRAFTADEDRPGGPEAIIVSHGFWQERLGGRADVLEQAIDVGGRPRPIVGVAPPAFEFPRGAQLWMPVKNNEEQCGRGCVFLNGVGRLAEGVTAEAAQREMTAIAAALERAFPDGNTDVTVMVQTLQDRTVGSVRLALLVLLAAVAMVLLIACANVANLVLVRGAARQTEIAVRAALGAGRRGIVSYLLTENLLLACAGGTLGLMLAWWGVDALRLLAPADLPRLDDVRFDVPTFAFAAAMVMVTTLVFGLGPSFRLSRTPLAPALGHRGAVGHVRQRWARSALLIAEVGSSLVLLLGAGLLVRSVSALQRTDLGFDTGGRATFTLSLPAARYPAEQVSQIHDRLDEELSAVPGVSRVARISELPLGRGENVLSFTRPDLPPPAVGQGPSARIGSVDADYFETMGIPILAGRGFTEIDRIGAQGAVVVSRRMREVFWPGENPVGRPIQISDRDPGIVVGVVGDVRSSELGVAPQPEMFVPHAQAGNRTMSYIVQSGLGPAEVLAAARGVVRRLDTRLPLISPGSMDELVARHLGRPRFYVVLLGLFAALAVVLAAIGIYGVVAYAVTERTQEIGVRMALGARRSEVVGLILWHGLRPALVGVGVGMAVAVAAGRVMRGMLYEVQPDDPLTLALATVGLLTTVVIASAIPARRASGVQPAQALRGEAMFEQSLL
ncbi:MAG: ABC transporter permease [Acidobacteria bacterium]|nr:ABC transporter permease [Acidobacteriota bacterium]